MNVSEANETAQNLIDTNLVANDEQTAESQTSSEKSNECEYVTTSVKKDENLVAAAGAAGRRVLHLDEFEPAETLPSNEVDAYERRFVTLLQEPEVPHMGGSATVLRVSNLWGETFALKILTNASLEDDARRTRREEAFRSEYRLQRTLSGLKGFPRIFGIGRIEGAYALVMEWMEGVNLEKVTRILSADDEKRVSPLVAARIGCKLFDLVARMDLVEGGIVHRDISTGNVIVRTDRLTLDKQVDKGDYDLCLIDFGSASTHGNTSSKSTLFGPLAAGRGVTPDFAAPELLAGNEATSAADVYAAASVVWRLASGHAPFESPSTEHAENLQRAKMHDDVEEWQTIHHAEDVAGVLPHEPEVAMAVRQAAADLASAPTPNEVAAALQEADAPLGDILRMCLNPDPASRPSAKQMRNALESFSLHYAENIGRALRGEPRALPTLGALTDGYGSAMQRRRTVMRVTGKALGAALGVAAVATAAVSSGMAIAPFSALPLPAGVPAGSAAAAATALPFACGAIARLRTRGVAGLARATAGAIVGALTAYFGSAAASPPQELAECLAAAILASLSGAWCFFAMDFVAPAANTSHLHDRRIRLRLPQGSNVNSSATLNRDGIYAKRISAQRRSNVASEFSSDKYAMAEEHPERGDLL